MRFISYRSLAKTVSAAIAVLALPCVAMAAETTATTPGAPVGSYQMARYILTGICVLLLFVILALGNAVMAVGRIYQEREKPERRHKGSATSLLLLAMLTASWPASAQEAASGAASTGPGIPKDIYLFYVIAGLEFLIVLALTRILLRLLSTKEAQPVAYAAPALPARSWFRRLNQTVAIEEEAQLDLKHDYDGIRELDNKVPAWWRYSFYASILFGVIYIYRMFVSESLPDQLRELQAANVLAEVQKAEYLKHAANNVDENNVAMLDAAGIAEGAGLFARNCQACHGDKGQGGVGPNLTDAYWLHNGSLKDIFKSIKYGWAEKGMKAWKDDFSPAQIAQLSSYVSSLQGSNPPGGKEPQGALYTEEAVTATADTTKSGL